MTVGTKSRTHDFSKLAVGYIRVSTKEQGENGVSLDAQRVAIETFADIAGYTLIETFNDVSSGVGEKSFHHREGLKYALELASRSKADFLVWDWDRLSRHTDFDQQVRKVFPDDDWIICVKKQNTMREASRKAIFAHGEKIANRISQATKRGMERKSAAGVVFGNPMIRTCVQPLGVAANSNNAVEHVHRIVEVLRKLNDPFATTYTEISDILNAKGIRTLHGKEWTASRARIPVTKARDLLRKEDELALRSLPTYGIA